MLNLALQGGGSHGAFTWGVLDRLLEDPDLGIDGISATSAGAMNAAVLAHGLLDGGRDGAREALAAFWSRVAQAAAFGPLPAATPGIWNRDWDPQFFLLDVLSRLLSPYQLNPLGLDPLRGVLAGLIDVDRLRETRSPQLFVCATNVRTGDIQVFRNRDLSIDALLASACLPFLHQAVEIDGEAYWDGGYMGNPALYPLIQNCACDDIVIVQINPIRDVDVPKDARRILDRANEISFNATLIRELRAIDLINEAMTRRSGSGGRRLKRINVHMIQDEAFMTRLGFSSKLDASWGFLVQLRDKGREAASAWLAGDARHLGVRSTFDVSGFARSGRPA